MKFEVEKVKIVVAVPKDNTEIVREAMCEAGAGVIGNYSFCSCCVKSIGTFLPNGKANPFIGEKNKLEYVEEEKLELICDVKIVKKVIKSIRSVHPYEEPAIDIFPLLSESDFD